MADREDAANGALAQKLQHSEHSGADLFTGLLVADTRPRAALAAADYSLGSPDFASPAAHEVAALKVEGYSLEAPNFGTPYAAPYVPGVWRITWCGNEGRRPDIPPDKKPGLIAATRSWVAEKRIMNLKRISHAHRVALIKYVRELAKNEGVEASDRVLREQIIRPALSEM